MKLNKDFIMRNIAGEYILVPTGDAIKKFNGLVAVSGIGGFIWECIENGCEKEEILSRIMETYEVEESVARSDMEEFINMLKKHEIIEL